MVQVPIRRINIFAASSYGKTTLAMELTVALNKLGYNAAYVCEQAKELVLRGYRQPEPIDQVHIGAGQMERELTALRNFPLIVTDSPVHLAPVYCRFYGGDSMLAGILTNMAFVLDRDYPALNVLLGKPNFPYVAAQRWQSEDEAEKVQAEIIAYLDCLQIPYMQSPSLGDILKIVQEGLDKGVVPSYG